NLKAIAKIDKHKMHQEIRRCKGHVIMDGLEKVEMKCPVQFKVFRCDNCSTYKLFQNNEHSSGCEDIITDEDMVHPDSHVFGIHPKVKVIINEFNEPIVCNGENADNSFRIGMTSKKLLSFVRDMVLRNMIFHLDCTYRLTKNRFPFLVFGFSDLNGQFHPIAFTLISHERFGDFDWFFGALKNVFNSMGILFSPTYMMMDANDASYIAVEKDFPNCIVLIKKETILNKWSSMGLHDFRAYFEKEWFSVRFWRWQLFHVPQGYAITNSCLESYNKLIKLLYTNYISYTIHEMLKIVMTKVVNYHS
ncbi:hypothetical protein BpHYR1_018328, partial [Brachionus plicatilis]